MYPTARGIVLEQEHHVKRLAAAWEMAALRAPWTCLVVSAGGLAALSPWSAALNCG